MSLCLWRFEVNSIDFVLSAFSTNLLSSSLTIDIFNVIEDTNKVVVIVVVVIPNYVSNASDQRPNELPNVLI